MSSEIRWDDSQSLLTTLLAGTPRKASTEEDNRHVQEDIKALTQLDELLALVLTLDQGEAQFLDLTTMIGLSFYNRTLGEGKYASVQCQRFLISQLPTELPSLPRLMGHEFVAVKRCKDARGVEEILGELRARVPRALRNHPNIVGLLGYGWDAADDAFFAPFLAMEYATYGSLEYALNSFSFSIDEKRNLCVDVALGLEAIHGSDFIHGVSTPESRSKSLNSKKLSVNQDIKPQNVLLSRHEVRTWTAKLTDFGMSASTLSDTKSEFHYFGTRVYNAPEVGLSQRDTLLTLEAAQKCDVYSYGLVVCVLIKGGYEQARHIFEIPPAERLRAALLSVESDGIPERYLVPITIVLWSTLPHEPAHRGTMEGIRENWLGVPR
jgi:serine/threonine protein kinase